jgi:2,3-bisphosphoglycerate-independent phosphoglycerate mutase
LKPHLVKTAENSRIQKGDVVVFYNIRGDRARQITKALFSVDGIPFEDGRSGSALRDLYSI